MDIKIKRLRPDAKLPSYALPGDVGMDMYFAEDDITIAPGERKVLMAGFALEFPPLYGAFVMDKSGVSTKLGLKNFGGVFDAGYRGEYNVGLYNMGDEPQTIQKGQKIGQLVILPIIHANLIEVDELGESERGVGGFGSTGIF